MKRPGYRPHIPFRRTIPWVGMSVSLLLILVQAAVQGLPLTGVAVEVAAVWVLWLITLYVLGRWWRANWLTYYRTARWWRRARRTHARPRG